LKEPFVEEVEEKFYLFQLLKEPSVVEVEMILLCLYLSYLMLVVEVEGVVEANFQYSEGVEVVGVVEDSQGWVAVEEAEEEGNHSMMVEVANLLKLSSHCLWY
jgi:hypothetical protein